MSIGLAWKKVAGVLTVVLASVLAAFIKQAWISPAYVYRGPQSWNQLTWVEFAIDTVVGLVSISGWVLVGLGVFHMISKKPQPRLLFGGLALLALASILHYFLTLPFIVSGDPALHG